MPAKFDRCVKSAKKTAKNPYAACNAAAKGKGWGTTGKRRGKKR